MPLLTRNSRLSTADSDLRLTNISRWSSLYSSSADRTQNTASNSSSIIGCLLIATETRLCRRCLVMAITSSSTILAFSCRVTRCQQLLLQISHRFTRTTCFSQKRPSSDTRALTIPLFFPPAKPPYTGQCLHSHSCRQHILLHKGKPRERETRNTYTIHQHLEAKHTTESLIDHRKHPTKHTTQQ
jgi:ribosomal protein L35